jgi:PIN domain nuclease of toxin-antitoxin system
MGNSQLSAKVRDLVEDRHNHKLISVATVWEMSIKQSQNKLILEKTAADYIEGKISLDNFELLPITLNYLRVLSSLPFYHKDPFDRLLIAQAMQENIPILSKDIAFDADPIPRIWD